MSSSVSSSAAVRMRRPRSRRRGATVAADSDNDDARGMTRNGQSLTDLDDYHITALNSDSQKYAEVAPRGTSRVSGTRETVLPKVAHHYIPGLE